VTVNKDETGHSLDKFKKDVIGLRIRYYLLNSNGSLIDGVGSVAGSVCHGKNIVEKRGEEKRLGRSCDPGERAGV
jgi:hypothetical protein